MMRGIVRKAVWFVAGVAVALVVRGEFDSSAFAQPANDGMYLRIRNEEARLNALENQQAIARLKNMTGPPTPAAPLGSWIPGGTLAGEDMRMQIAALQKQVQAQQKALENLQKEVTRVCEAGQGPGAENPNSFSNGVPDVPMAK